MIASKCQALIGNCSACSFQCCAAIHLLPKYLSTLPFGATHRCRGIGLSSLTITHWDVQESTVYTVTFTTGPIPQMETNWEHLIAWYSPIIVKFRPISPSGDLDHSVLVHYISSSLQVTYCMAENFDGKNIWQIALIMTFGYIHSKMVTCNRLEQLAVLTLLDLLRTIANRTVLEPADGR